MLGSELDGVAVTLVCSGTNVTRVIAELAV